MEYCLVQDSKIDETNLYLRKELECMMLIIPEFFYIIFLCSGTVLSLVSLFMIIRGIIKKRERRYFIRWSIVLLICLVAVRLMTTGVIVANTMIGGY